jgi:predicted amidophosphoribosyltransferase
LAILLLYMNDNICPYCREKIDKPSADMFTACPLCGYRSARLASEPHECLIIDSRLPDLMDKFQDRRVGQMPIAGTDRRR